MLLCIENIGKTLWEMLDMGRKWVLLVCIVLVCGMVLPTAMVAGKKPDKPPGGGGGDTPPGTLFFVHDDGTGGAIWTMKGDGSSKTKATTYGDGVGMPSRDKHGGHYWYIGFGKISGETYPDGLDRMEIFAVRDDNDKTVQLTNDATLAASSYSWFVMWGHDDSYISWVAKKWDSTEGSGTLGKCGIWWQSIAFDDSGDVTGLTGTPTLEWETDYWYSKSQDKYYPIPRAHDVSPDGTKIVYNYINSKLYIVNRASDTESYLADGWGPKWSPDGAKIAFEVGTQAVKIINPDGTGEKTLASVSNTKGWYYRIGYVAWSPDSEYVSYWWQKWSSKLSQGHGQNIYIIKTDGKGKTCLTNDLDLDTMKVNRAWR